MTSVREGSVQWEQEWMRGTLFVPSFSFFVFIFSLLFVLICPDWVGGVTSVLGRAVRSIGRLLQSMAPHAVRFVVFELPPFMRLFLQQSPRFAASCLGFLAPIHDPQRPHTPRHHLGSCQNHSPFVAPCRVQDGIGPQL